MRALRFWYAFVPAAGAVEMVRPLFIFYGLLRLCRAPRRTGLNFYKNFPVILSGVFMISSGVPAATIRPPASPPPGPMSMI